MSATATNLHSCNGSASCLTSPRSPFDHLLGLTQPLLSNKRTNESYSTAIAYEINDSGFSVARAAARAVASLSIELRLTA